MGPAKKSIAIFPGEKLQDKLELSEATVLVQNLDGLGGYAQDRQLFHHDEITV